jgi:adenosylcobinamide kinase/adenosylcobinamide-phosphate guanylyltransferase
VRIFISGGCKNGKSRYAQRLAKAQETDSLYYIATMKPVDSEDRQRIERHRRERDGLGFTTVEQPNNIENVLSKCGKSGSFLLDSLTALLANEMFMSRGGVNERAHEKIIRALSEITSNVKNIVIVSDYIYSDAFLYDALTERYRKSLAEIDRAAANYCDVVLEASYANLIVHKGRESFKEIYEKIL